MNKDQKSKVLDPFSSTLWVPQYLLDNAVYDVIEFKPDMIIELWDKQSFFSKGHMKTGRKLWEQQKEKFGKSMLQFERAYREEQIFNYSENLECYVRNELSKMLDQFEAFREKHQKLHRLFQQENQWFYECWRQLLNMKQWIDDVSESIKRTDEEDTNYSVKWGENQMSIENLRQVYWIFEAFVINISSQKKRQDKIYEYCAELQSREDVLNVCHKALQEVEDLSNENLSLLKSYFEKFSVYQIELDKWEREVLKDKFKINQINIALSPILGVIKEIESLIKKGNTNDGNLSLFEFSKGINDVQKSILKLSGAEGDSVEEMMLDLENKKLRKELLVEENERLKSQKYTKITRPSKESKSMKEVPKTFDKLFHDSQLIEPCIQILRELDPPVIDTDDNYIGNLKSVFCVWVDEMRRQAIMKHFSDRGVYASLIPNRIKNFSIDESMFGKRQKRAEEKYGMDIKAKVSSIKLSLDSQKGK